MHGALLAVGELIGNAKELMIHRVKEVSENVLKLKDFANKGDKGIIKRVVVDMMPRLAVFSPEMFYRFYFNSCTEFLLSIVSSKEETDKVAGFSALGNILAVCFIFICFVSISFLFFAYIDFIYYVIGSSIFETSRNNFTKIISIH